MKSHEYLQTQDQQARAWGAWLSKYEWDYFGTFTFSEQYTEVGARRAFERFMRRSELRKCRACFFGIERGTRYDRVHLHSVFQWPPEHRPTAEIIWRLWFESYGRAKVEVPECQADVAAYAAKYASKDMVDYDLLGAPWRMPGQ